MNAQTDTADDEPSPAAAEPFSIDVTEAEGHVVVALTGDFDLSGRERFYERFDPVRGASLPVVLDVSGLDFVDSAGLGCLCYARNALFQRTGHAPRLVGASPRLRQLIRQSGIDDLFDWEASTN